MLPVFNTLMYFHSPLSQSSRPAFQTIRRQFSLPMNLKTWNFLIAETDSLSPLGERVGVRGMVHVGVQALACPASWERVGVRGRFMESFNDSRITHRDHAPHSPSLGETPPSPPSGERVGVRGRSMESFNDSRKTVAVNSHPPRSRKMKANASSRITF